MQGSSTSTTTGPFHATWPARWLAALVLCVAASAAQAWPVYWVGTDGNCSHSTLQVALATAAADGSDTDTIFLTNEISYSHVQVVIDNKTMNLIGGYQSCGGPVDSNPTTITAASGHSVIEITGNSSVYLNELVLAGANLDGSHNGGGIHFGGVGSLSLNHVSVTSNTSGYGGGIGMSPSGPSTLDLVASVVNLNTASVEGGGIRIEGQTTLTTDAATFITFNAASGYGGGIEVIGPATASIRSSVNNNSAANGGGIVAFGRFGDPAIVKLYSLDGTSLPFLYANHASSNGGGIYLKSSATGAVAALCAADFGMQSNTASDGAAIYADTNSGYGADVSFNSFARCGQPADAVHCAAGVTCNEIDDNVSQNANGNATGGATIQIGSGGGFGGTRFAMRRNTGGSMIQFAADAGTTSTADNEVVLYDCLLADNAASASPGHVVDAHGGHANTALAMTNCTIADNALSSSSAIHADVAYASLGDSIVFQPATQRVFDSSNPPQTLSTQNVLSAEVASLGNGAGNLQGAPTFVDFGNGDYHLQRNSLGVDYAQALSGSDLDGNPRAVDLADIANVFGPVDLGAYEIQTQLTGCQRADTIFCNGFELP